MKKQIVESIALWQLYEYANFLLFLLSFFFLTFSLFDILYLNKTNRMQIATRATAFKRSRTQIKKTHTHTLRIWFTWIATRVAL